MEDEAKQKALIKNRREQNAISNAKKKLKMQIETDSDENCPAKQNESESFSNNDLIVTSYYKTYCKTN